MFIEKSSELNRTLVNKIVHAVGNPVQLVAAFLKCFDLFIPLLFKTGLILIAGSN